MPRIEVVATQLEEHEGKKRSSRILARESLAAPSDKVFIPFIGAFLYAGIAHDTLRVNFIAMQDARIRVNSRSEQFYVEPGVMEVLAKKTYRHGCVHNSYRNRHDAMKFPIIKPESLS